MKKILVIDGGGCRGIVGTWLLTEIERRTGKRCAELFNLVGGASVGSIVALSLVVPDPNNPQKPKYSASDLSEIFKKDIKIIFKPNIFRYIYSLWGLVRPKFSNKALRAAMEKRFGKCTLKEALTDIVVPAYDLRNGSLMCFKNIKAKQEPSRDYYISDVCLASTAAPSLLQIPWIKSLDPNDKPKPYADGGLAAYNYPIVTLSEARKSNYDFEDFIIVSVGTGRPPLKIKDKNINKWGFLRWFFPLMKTLLWGGMEVTDYFMEKNFNLPNEKRKYYRLQIDLTNSDKVFEMDNFSDSHFSHLRERTDEFINKNNDMINELCERLTKE